jgi:hypothetical protein
MNAIDHDNQLAADRRLIREASERLLAGAPQRSDGKLTIATLAIEAGVRRHRLYEHHADLVAEFRTRTAGFAVSPDVQGLRQQLADAHEKIRALQATEAALEAKIKTLCAVIAELTHEAKADNVVALPAGRRRRP